jgi:hypothetical protein
MERLKKNIIFKNLASSIFKQKKDVFLSFFILKKTIEENHFSFLRTFLNANNIKVKRINNKFSRAFNLKILNNNNVSCLNNNLNKFDKDLKYSFNNFYLLQFIDFFDFLKIIKINKLFFDKFFILFFILNRQVVSLNNFNSFEREISICSSPNMSFFFYNNFLVAFYYNYFLIRNFYFSKLYFSLYFVFI